MKKIFIILTIAVLSMAALYAPPFANPMTTGGDIIYGAASGVATRLANGTAGQVLKSAGGTSAPTWSNPINQMIYCTGGNGYGSTSTKIRRYDSCTTTGTDVTGADSATLGEVITINVAGVYCLWRNDFDDAANADVGISVNSNQLTTNVSTITASHRFAIWESMNTSASMGAAGGCSYFSAADVIRPHDNAANSDAADVYVWIRVTRVN